MVLETILKGVFCMEGIRPAPIDLRIARREAVRAKNEPPLLTIGEEAFNAVSHGLGAAFSVMGFVLLLLRSDTALKMTASCFYGISMMVMMLCSCIYHAMPAGSAVKRICRRLDYSSIYLLIGGTFAPVLLVFLGSPWGVVFFCVQWGVILLGVTLVAVFGPGRWRPLHFTLYFVLGWSGLLFLPSLYRYDRILLFFIFLGGIAYTIGMVPFARSKKYDHCVWHLFVLAGAMLHWVGIYTCLY